MADKKVHIKSATLNKDGNGTAIKKLADSCDFHSLLKTGYPLFLFENCSLDDHPTVAAASEGQIPTGLGSLHKLLPILNKLYALCVVEANENDTDKAFQTDSSNRLYASLKRHPE